MSHDQAFAITDIIEGQLKVESLSKKTCLATADINIYNLSFGGYMKYTSGTGQRG